MFGDPVLKEKDSALIQLDNQEMSSETSGVWIKKHKLPKHEQQIQTEAENSVTLRNLQGDIIGTFSLGDLQAHRYSG